MTNEPKVSDLATHAQFLLDRLAEFESELGEGQEREWAGHVMPAIARLRDALARKGKGRSPVVGWWPEGARFAHGDFVKTTFDVEGRIVGAHQLDDEREPGYALNVGGRIVHYPESLLSNARF